MGLGSIFSSISSFLGGSSGGGSGYSGSEPIQVGLSTVGNLIGKSLEDKLINDPNSAQAYERSMEAAKWAWAQELDAYKRRYRNTMDDMKDAGLNPIMAATGGFNVGNGPDPSMPQTFMTEQPNFNMDMASSARQFSEISKIQEEKKKLQAETKKIMAETTTEIHQALKVREEARLVSTEEKLTSQKIFNAEQEFNKLSQEIDLTKGITALNQQEQLRVRRVIETLDQNLKKIRQMGQVYEGPAGKAISYINAVFGQLNIGAAATGSAIIRH